MTTPLADLIRSMAADGCSIETIANAIAAAELHGEERHEPSLGALRMRRFRARHKVTSLRVTPVTHNTKKIPNNREKHSVTSDVTGVSLLSLEEDINIKKKGRASLRGKRLASDWLPSPATCEAMRLDCGVDGDAMEATLKRFRDYWIAIPGQKGCKLDWDATLRNWIRKDCENGQTQQTAGSFDERYERAREAFSSGRPLNGASR